MTKISRFQHENVSGVSCSSCKSIPNQAVFSTAPLLVCTLNIIFTPFQLAKKKKKNKELHSFLKLLHGCTLLNIFHSLPQCFSILILFIYWFDKRIMERKRWKHCCYLLSINIISSTCAHMELGLHTLEKIKTFQIQFFCADFKLFFSNNVFWIMFTLKYMQNGLFADGYASFPTNIFELRRKMSLKVLKITDKITKVHLLVSSICRKSPRICLLRWMLPWLIK